MFQTVFLTIFITFLIIVFGSLALGGLLAAPWVPLWSKEARRLLRLAEIKPGQTVYDLGAGDGRIVIMAAKEFSAQATGFEIACLPYFIGWIRIAIAGLQGKAHLKYANFFKADLSQADVICTFLSIQAMAKLKSKFEKELKPGGRIVSYAFAVPGWTPKKIDKPTAKSASIYLYQK